MQAETSFENSAPVAPVSFWQAFLYWLKLGFISFGGPAGQISMMHQELVEKRRWISEKRFIHALNYTMMLPGPEAQQLATYIGWLMHGIKGGICAGVLFVLPSLLILIALSYVYFQWGHLPLLQSVLAGIKPAVTAIVLFAAWRIGQRTLHNRILKSVALLAFAGIFIVQLPFPLIIALAAICGWLLARYRPDTFKTSSAHASALRSGPALIDDHTPLPAHAQFNAWRLFKISSGILCLFLTCLLTLVVVYGWQSVYAQMALFFSKAALLTFGGAYAVLPYVLQAAVQDFHWLSAPQMIDGLALGETTPGPLIMLVAYVGFAGGWNLMPLGAETQLLAASLGAVVATVFTFIPSFFFILAGGPWVEASRHSLPLHGPLAAISAAVVGVILNLALFFAWHVLWPQGWQGDFMFAQALLGSAAFIALFKFEQSIVRVIMASAVIGALFL